MELTLIQAKQLLKGTHRYELRDCYFGDKEVTFKDPHTGKTIANGYSSISVCDVTFLSDSVFTGEEAYQLLQLGTLVNVSRNDSLGDVD